MAELGLCSRREADALIESGDVLVNGTQATLGQKVAATDTVTLKHANRSAKRYFAYYKGRGIISHSPDESETDIATQLQEKYNLTNVYPVGRLDKDSEGLIIVTDDVSQFPIG